MALIGLDGGGIQSMAKTQNVSKQAISVMANDLEKFGYLSRHLKLQPMLKWFYLILLSKAAVDGRFDVMISMIEKEFIEILCAKAFKQLQQGFKTLYFGLKLEAELLVNNKLAVNTSLDNLAKLVKQHYTPEQVSELTRQLMI